MIINHITGVGCKVKSKCDNRNNFIFSYRFSNDFDNTIL